jgi:hypothetical protein
VLAAAADGAPVTLGSHRARLYVKLLPQPEETDPAERLNAYLARRAAG